MIHNIYKERIRQVNNSKSIIKGSTPVLFFGNIEKAEIATISLNPSQHEFQRNGQLFKNLERRFETLQSLNVETLQDLDDDGMLKIYNSCLNYFDRAHGGRPYKTWFNPINNLIKDSIEKEYFDGTCCHLDLIQWATNPVWAKLEPAEKEQLLEKDLKYLKDLISISNFNLLLLNGTTTFKTVSDILRTTLVEENTIYFGKNDNENANGLNIWRSYLEIKSKRIKLIGWNRYIQKGINNYEKQKLKDILKIELER